ncbi:hypothetical protein [Paraburkholderia caledonica]|uniref:Phage tail protein n=1 Tax=Paraburkholderia caledonica TaxID=134536 RepID=A0AB73IPV0_9BURK|nr:hypothetical protein [Paraburkholderia caledonica]
MTTFVIANNVSTTLASAASSSSTTFTLASAANLPALSAGQIMPLTLNDAATGQIYEIVYVTAISGVTVTVTRAQEGTGAQNWNIGDFAFCAPTAGSVATANGNANNQFAGSPATAGNQFATFAQIACVRGAFSNLKLSATGANSTLNISADQLIVRDANALAYALSNVSLAPTTGGATGINSLDTGSWAFNTWYAVHVAYNPTTQTYGALFSLSATAPTLPPGYTAWARVSWIRTPGSTNYNPLGFKQNGRTVRYLPSGSLFPVLLSSGSASTYTAIATGNFVPPTAAKIGVYSYSSTSASTAWVGIISSDGVVADFNISGNGNFGWVNEVYLLLVSTNIYYTTSGVSPALYLGCSGWEDNL